MVNYLVQPAPRGNGGAQQGAPTGECSHRSSLDAVADVPIWFRWKLEPNEKGALTKVPYCAHHEGQASHTKPRDRGTLTQARASLERWGGNGLGIVAAALDDQYVHACLDVDGCYPPDSDQRGEWVEPAAAILAGCYHERSFSLTGEHYHFLVRREVAAKRRWRINAKRPSAGGLKDHGFELAVSLDGGYYLTCTLKGEGDLRVIEEPELQALYDYINSFKLRPKKQHKAPTSVSSSREPDLHANTLAAIATLANDSRFVDRDDWIVIGMAAHDGTGGSAAGLRAWIAWTERLHADAENACSRAWATFTEGGGTTVATLFMFAREDGWLDPRQPRTRTDYAPLPNDEAEPEGGEAKANGAAIENAAEVEDAKEITWPEPEPLISDTEPPPPYPIEALPDLMRHAVEEVQLFVQAPDEMVAASAMSALAIATQHLIDVRRTSALQGPSGLYYLVIADSGDRKTTIDRFFMTPVYEYEWKERETGKATEADHAAKMAVWEAKKKAAIAGLESAAKGSKAKDDKAKTRRKRKTLEAYQADLADLEKNKPTPPRIPRLIYADATQEKLLRCLATGWPSAAIVSSEGGAVFGAHAMGRDSVMRTLGALNVLWDGGTLQVDRVGDGSFVVRGARLSINIQVQAAVLRDFMEGTKGLARGSGFLARFLIAYPETRQGTRMFREAPASWPALTDFNARISALLATKVAIRQSVRPEKRFTYCY